MSLESTLGAIIFFFMFISLILYVLFGQITVRKLRKNPETKRELGVEFASGWDIVNVAEALSMPPSIMQKIRKGPIGAMYTNSDLLYKNTNWFDRWLARLFYWLFMSSGLSMILLVALNALGVFA